jgi:uncharacterized protein (TIGR02271 family)
MAKNNVNPEHSPGSGGETLPLAEEVVRVAKHDVVTGTIRARTVTETVRELAHVELETQAVDVTRVPVDRIVAEVPEIRTEGDVTIVPVVEEVAVVEKRLVLREELHIRKRRSLARADIPVERRKQKVLVERLPSEED